MKANKRHGNTILVEEYVGMRTAKKQETGYYQIKSMIASFSVHLQAIPLLPKATP